MVSHQTFSRTFPAVASISRLSCFLFFPWNVPEELWPLENSPLLLEEPAASPPSPLSPLLFYHLYPTLFVLQEDWRCRDEYCKGRLLFPLTNHPSMSRGEYAAMFYSSPQDALRPSLSRSHLSLVSAISPSDRTYHAISFLSLFPFLSLSLSTLPTDSVHQSQDVSTLFPDKCPDHYLRRI